jgi:hypothetical protein
MAAHFREWQTVKTVSPIRRQHTRLKPGANERNVVSRETAIRLGNEFANGNSGHRSGRRLNSALE